MEMNKISGFSMNAGYKPGVKVCPDKEESIVPGDAFSRGEQFSDQSSRMRDAAGQVKKSWGSSDDLQDVMGNVVGGFCGVVGGVLGCAIGLVYDATVIGPLIGGGVYADDYCNVGYFEGLVNQFTKPVTLAIKGAKRGFSAGRNAVMD